MKKNNIRMAVVLGVLLALAHLLVFLLPFQRGRIFWFSYVFMLIAFFVAGASSALAFKDRRSLKSRFYGIPIIQVGGLYLGIQGILTLLFMALGELLAFWLVLLVNAFLLGAAILGLVAQDAVRDHALELDTQLDQDVSVIRALQSTMNVMVLQCSNSECRAAVQELSDELRYSDPVSNSALTQIESELSVVIDDLQQAVVDCDNEGILVLCTHAKNLLLERNRQCKLSKRTY